MNGKHEVLSITIKPRLWTRTTSRCWKIMVAAAINATVKQVDETAEAEMGKLTGGLNIRVSEPGREIPWTTMLHRWKS